MIETGSQNTHSIHLAGIIPVAGQKLDFNFPWHDCLQPIGKNYLAIERAAFSRRRVGCTDRSNLWLRNANS